MDQWVNYKELSGIIYFPGVVVNNIPYHGNLEVESVTEDICSSMKIIKYNYRYVGLNTLFGIIIRR